MSTAFFPQGMESYNNSRTAPFTAAYKTWKGDGKYSNPVGITAGTIRPLTNKDYFNIAVYKQGSTRPQKWQARKGTVTQVPYTIINPNDPSQYITIDANRMNKSTAGLENKSGGLLGQLMDRPGSYSVKHNPTDEINETTQSIVDCKTCDGISVVTNFYPSDYLTNNPQPVCTNPPLCCNEPRKALLRVRPASTNLKKNYFTTLQQYRQNRCQTYEQRVFNFKTESDAFTDAALLKNNPNITPQMLAAAKPGSPLTTFNTYVGNCYPNTGLSTYTQVELVALAFQLLNNEGVFSNDDITNFYNLKITTIGEFVAFISALKSGNEKEAAFYFSNFINNPYYGMSLSGPSNPNGCKLVSYKPNNPQFAVQGAVSSSARTLKLGVTTIETNVNNSNAYRGSPSTINPGQQPFIPFIYKSKVQKCSPVYPIIFRQVSYNPKTCFKNTDDAQSADFQYNGNLSAGPTVANNGVSASNPGGQPIR
uniref:Uncharacterized protein n=1 Tax=viral metagenome TaxID=1070528 RepID=A0A6C0AZC3_9ZZZZ